jgi:hypothetical protein
MDNKMYSNNLNDFLDTKVFFPRDQGEIADWLIREAIKVRFNAIAQHVDFANQSITKEREFVEAAAWQFVQTMGINDPVEQNAAYRALMCDGYSPLHNEYPLALNAFSLIQWRSEFLFVYSLFEHTLDQLCYKVQKRSNFKLTLKDMSGKGIDRVRNYLVKLAGVEAPFLSRDWQRAKLLAEIRNKIAHANGEIEYTPDVAKSLSSRLKDEQHIKVERDFQNKKYAEIILSYEFVKQAVDDLHKVVTEVCIYPLYADKS